MPRPGFHAWLQGGKAIHFEWSMEFTLELTMRNISISTLQADSLPQPALLHAFCLHP